MPVTPTYPGVYIEEVPSGVRTITGVATAITAFIGRAPRGPVNDPTRVQNFGDYTRAFGGLSLDSTMSFAVQQFFNNGGTDAVIVRVYEPSAGETGIGSVVLAADVRARGTLTLTAQPTVGDTMTIGSTVYTFRANGSKLETPEAPIAGQPVPTAVNVEIGATILETQSTIIRAINRLGTTGFRASTTAEKNVVAADRWVSNTLVLTAAEDGTGGNAIATHSTFAKSSNKFDDTTLGSTSEGRDPDPAVAAQGTLSITAQPALARRSRSKAAYTPSTRTAPSTTRPPTTSRSAAGSGRPARTSSTRSTPRHQVPASRRRRRKTPTSRPHRAPPLRRSS